MLTLPLQCQRGSGVCVTVPFPSAQQEGKLIRITKNTEVSVNTKYIHMPSGDEWKV